VPSAGGLAFRLSGAVNSLLKGVLLVELSGRDIVLGNTHLTANKDGDWSVGNRYNDLHRRQLTRLQAAVASRIPALTIVGGDFNLASSGALYHRILDDGAWRDPFAATGSRCLTRSHGSLSRCHSMARDRDTFPTTWR
jgi:hypothetical protein